MRLLDGKSVFVWILIFCSALSVSIAAADEVGTSRIIRITAMPFPPLIHETLDGKVSGTLIETVRYQCEAAGLECIFYISPIKRTFSEVRSGAADAVVTLNINQFHYCCETSTWSSYYTAGLFSLGEPETIPDTEKDLEGKQLINVMGMESIQSFVTDLDDMINQHDLTVFDAPGVLTATKMFLNKRAPLLWGGEDFKWYLGKLDPVRHYTFKPLVKIPVVVWFRNKKSKIAALFNQAYARVKQKGDLDGNNVLVPRLMQKRYVDAPFKG